jgi:hypothetical protein
MRKSKEATKSVASSPLIGLLQQNLDRKLGSLRTSWDKHLKLFTTEVHELATTMALPEDALWQELGIQKPITAKPSVNGTVPATAARGRKKGTKRAPSKKLTYAATRLLVLAAVRQLHGTGQSRFTTSNVREVIVTLGYKKKTIDRSYVGLILNRDIQGLGSEKQGDLANPGKMRKFFFVTGALESRPIRQRATPVPTPEKKKKGNPGGLTDIIRQVFAAHPNIFMAPAVVKRLTIENGVPKKKGEEVYVRLHSMVKCGELVKENGAYKKIVPVTDQTSTPAVPTPTPTESSTEGSPVQ